MDLNAAPGRSDGVLKTKRVGTFFGTEVQLLGVLEVTIYSKS